MKNSETKDIQSHSRNTVLCDGFLIPMTDFVNNVGNMENYPSHENALSWIYNYATFLKQPLKLEMFVPCDEEGEILNYNEILESVKEGTETWAIWETAKEKVLFEGFEQYEDYECAKYEDVYVDEKICDGKFTIEKLIKYAEKTKIKLSQTALDSIFGETVA